MEFCADRDALTGLVKHLVALIENKDADTAKAECLVADKGLETTRSTNNDVRASLLVLQGLHVGLDWSTTIEDTSLDVGHVLAEAVVLVANLVSKLTSVAHDHNRNLAINRLNLLQSGEHKDGSLTETRLGLADNITTEKCLGNTGLLDCRSRAC